MNRHITIDCPPEILIGAHMNAETFARFMAEKAAIALFQEGRLSSGSAATWLGMSRTSFLLHAIEAGAVLLEDSGDDLARETSLIKKA